MIDLRNLVVGDTIQLDITARNTSDGLVTVPVSGWTTTAPSSVATVSSSGQLTAISTTGSNSYIVQVTYGGVIYTAPLTISALQDIVTGEVENSSNAIENAIVDFYDANSAQVGTAYTARDGSFRASVPATAVRFTIDLSLPDPTGALYYPEFAYGSNSYLNGTSCLAALPTLSASVPTALPAVILPYARSSGSPPPPPTGCL
jgi:hypothetical protein